MGFGVIGWPGFYGDSCKHLFVMTRTILILVFIIAVGSCKEPAKVTARPDPTAATSGTLGSQKASDGIIPFKPRVVPDSTHGH